MPACFVRSQKDRVVGQIIGLPLTMFLLAALGVVLTAASVNWSVRQDMQRPENKETQICAH